MSTDNSGLFEWQFPNPDRKQAWDYYSFNEERWWGEFSRNLEPTSDLFAEYPWAIGPFTKYENNPIFAPEPGAWDCGRYDGGVHNGSILHKDGTYYYVYRGERPIDIDQKSAVDYICDIGVASSGDGVIFERIRDHSPFFREGSDRRYSYEDVNICLHEGTYYMFCNQWLWEEQGDTSQNGTYLATSKDLLRWEKHGIVFPNASRIHRNGVVLQSPNNEALRVNCKFVMYINDGLIAYSDDLVHWKSQDNPHAWPGGEGCFALANHNPNRPEDIILFTGGNHTGHFYAIGEVLLSTQDPSKPISWLPKPVLHADTHIPYENGRSALPPHQPISSFADCIFFNGLILRDGEWRVYYGGSEYYTCLATAPFVPK